ncbi:MAG: hypothetical protein ACPG4N_12190, partial [Gammaproteobacteria bacterium]
MSVSAGANNNDWVCLPDSNGRDWVCRAPDGTLSSTAQAVKQVIEEQGAKASQQPGPAQSATSQA